MDRMDLHEEHTVFRRGRVTPSICLLSAEVANRKARLEHMNWVYAYEKSADRFHSEKIYYKKHTLNLLKSAMYKPNSIRKTQIVLWIKIFLLGFNLVVAICGMS